MIEYEKDSPFKYNLHFSLIRSRPHGTVVTSHGSQMVYGLTIISNAFSLMPRWLSQHAAVHSRLPHVSIIGVMRGSQLEGEGGWEWSGSQFLAGPPLANPFIKNVTGQVLGRNDF